MGRVISMDAWKNGREPAVLPPLVPSSEASDDGVVHRLEESILRLEGLLPRAGHPSSTAGVDLETELLAIKGALSLSRFEEATKRAEKLVARLGGGLISRA